MAALGLEIESGSGKLDGLGDFLTWAGVRDMSGLLGRCFEEFDFFMLSESSGIIQGGSSGLDGMFLRTFGFVGTDVSGACIQGGN